MNERQLKDVLNHTKQLLHLSMKHKMDGLADANCIIYDYILDKMNVLSDMDSRANYYDIFIEYELGKHTIAETIKKIKDVAHGADC